MHACCPNEFNLFEMPSSSAHVWLFCATGCVDYMACVLFSLRATSCTIPELVAWWTDRAHGPIAEDCGSYLAAFSPCNEVNFAVDGTVTISVDASPTAHADSDDVVSVPPSEERASKAEDAAIAAAQVTSQI
jgi:hypothetical protein